MVAASVPLTYWMSKIALMTGAILVAGTLLLSLIGSIMAVVFSSHVYKISIYHGHMTNRIGAIDGYSTWQKDK